MPEFPEALFGRLHPLLVHLPIGFLVMAFLLDLLSKFKGYRKVRSAVAPVLFWGALAAIASAVSGYLLSQEGGYDEQILNLHQKGGIATAVLACIAYLQRKYPLSLSKPVRRSVSTIMITCLVILMTLTGHQGGTLTHGEGYLSLDGVMPEAEAAVKAVRYQGPPEEAKVYEDIIRPLLDAKCTGCHGPNKQKGKLRLDDMQSMLAGGKHGHLLDPGKSELFRRITLPVEDKEHMPPRAKAQLTSSEIDLIKAWINDGSAEGKRVSGYEDQRIYISWLTQAEEEPEYVLPELPAASPATIDQLKAAGAVVIPVAVNSHALEINLSYLKSVSPEIRERMQELSRQVVRLRLSGCAIEDADMEWISRLTELRVLFLDHTNVSDSGVGRLSLLPQLELLNLTDTKTTEKVLTELSGFPALRKVYLFGTKVSAGAVSSFHADHPKVLLDTGNVRIPLIAADTVVYRR